MHVPNGRRQRPVGKKAGGLFKPVENTYGVFYRQRPEDQAAQHFGLFMVRGYIETMP